MKKIFNLRGASGSGKSWAVRCFIETVGGFVPIHEAGKLTGYVNEEERTAVVGPYGTSCCGCGADTIKTMDERFRRVREFAERFDRVIFEGLMICEAIERSVELSTQYPTIFAFLDTPWEVCTKQVQQRRLARGDDRPFNPERNWKRWRYVRSTSSTLKGCGCDCRWLNHTDPVPQMKDWLGLVQRRNIETRKLLDSTLATASRA